MNRRRLGSTDLELTVLGLGTWAIGGPDWKFGWGASDDDAAVRAVVHGVERGFNWIDTAAIYGDGHAEVLVRDPLHRRRLLWCPLQQLRPQQRVLTLVMMVQKQQPEIDVVGQEGDSVWRRVRLGAHQSC